MKSGALRGIIQLILALAVVILLEMFYPTLVKADSTNHFYQVQLFL